MDLKFLRCAGEGAYRANLAKKITETQTLKLGGAMGRSRKGKLDSAAGVWRGWWPG